MITERTVPRARLASCLTFLVVTLCAGAGMGPGPARANGGGVVLKPPLDLMVVPPGSVRTLLKEVYARQTVVTTSGDIWVATQDQGLWWRAGAGPSTGVTATSTASASVPWSHTSSEPLVPEPTVTALQLHGGLLWLGFGDSGLVSVDPTGGLAKVKSPTRWSAKTGALPDDRVEALVTWNGRLWMLSESGLSVLDATRFIPAPVGANAPTGRVTAVSAGSDGRLWVGTDSAEVCSYDGKVWTRHEMRGRIAGRIVRAVCPSADTVWMGTFGSLNVLTPATRRCDDETAEKPSIFNVRIVSCLLRTGPWLLVGTSGGGVFRMHVPTHAWKRYAKANGLLSDTICTMTPTDSGVLVSGSAGVTEILLER